MLLIKYYYYLNTRLGINVGSTHKIRSHRSETKENKINQKKGSQQNDKKKTTATKNKQKSERDAVALFWHEKLILGRLSVSISLNHDHKRCKYYRCSFYS